MSWNKSSDYNNMHGATIKFDEIKLLDVKRVEYCLWILN